MGIRTRVRCLECNSLERTRLLWLYLEQLDLVHGMRVLHLAPETALSRKLIERVGAEHFVPADFVPENFPDIGHCRRIDLCHLDSEPSEQYDLIVHSHVLEHVPCTIAYPLFHLHRMLRRGGWHVCVIPFMPGRYEECLEDIGDEERARRFGQSDHVRRFGADDVADHVGKLLRLPAVYDARADIPVDLLIGANVPESVWTGFGTSTVLRLRRDDMVFVTN